MGFYLHVKCDQESCGFSANIGNATEFYVDAEGNEHIYGHPVCVSEEAARRGIAGYWRDLLCWNCGRVDRESIRLPKPCHDEAMAWAMFPPPSLKGHPRSCPDCGGILCDVGMLQMFLEYRADPAAARKEREEWLHDRKKSATEPEETEDYDAFLHAFIAEIHGDEGDTVKRVEAELADLQNVHTPEQMILHRLGLRPELPVTESSVAPLKEKLRVACERMESLQKEFFTRLDERGDQERGSEPSGSGSTHCDDPVPAWFRSSMMRAKRALDRQIEEARQLATHAWVAKRMLEDESGALKMFRKRCPKCKAEPLETSAIQT